MGADEDASGLEYAGDLVETLLQVIPEVYCVDCERLVDRRVIDGHVIDRTANEFSVRLGGPSLRDRKRIFRYVRSDQVATAYTGKLFNHDSVAAPYIENGVPA